MADKPHPARPHTANPGNNFTAAVPETPDEKPEAPKPAAAKKKTRPTDPALRLANRLDALMEAAPQWQQDWALNYLWAKYRAAKQETRPPCESKTPSS